MEWRPRCALNRPNWRHCRTEGVIHVVRTSVLVGGLLLALVGVVSAHASNPADIRPMEPDTGLAPYDIRFHDAATSARIANLRDSAAVKRRTEAATQLARRIPGAKVDLHPALTTPDFIRSTRSTLTAPAPALAPLDVVKQFIADQADLFGIAPAQLDDARLIRDGVSHNGVRTMWWQQEINGAPILGADLRVNILPDGRIVTIGSRMVPSQTLAGGRAKPGVVSRDQAVAMAAAAIGVDLVEPLRVVERQNGPTARTTLARTAQLNRDVIAEQVFFPVSFDDVRPAHSVTIGAAGEANVYEVIIDATTGELLSRSNNTYYGGAGAATYHVWTGDSPAPMTPGPDSPNGVQAPLVDRVMVTLEALDSVASPLGWITGALNETLGNNVDAHTDLNNDNAPDLPRPQGSPFRVFDFPINLNSGPSTYRNASVVQGFYMANWHHDRLHQLGFTEPFANFQDDNFGRGGIGGDRVSLDVHDGSGTNNANWNGTGVDGTFTWVQMYIFNGPNPDRDGNLDSHILIHELAHGTSVRLHGGLNGTQPRGMSEGWSDFFALALLAEPTDDPNGTYPMGGYSTLDGLGADFKDNYYFGIRRYPYTVDMSKNPLTFGDINSSLFNVDPSIPRNPVFGSSTPSQVHNVGEVWCANLWECRANLLSQYGFDGNEIMMQLVVDGMKLTTTSSPSMVQARDGILLADILNNDGENLCDLWAGFAKRGLGADAFSESESTSNIAESFDLPTGIAFIVDGGAPSHVQAGVPETFPIQLVNNCGAPFIPGSAKLVISVNGGPSQEIDLEPGDTDLDFSVILPALQCGDTATYFIAAETADGVYTFPEDGAVDPLTLFVITDMDTSLADDFEEDLGWFVFGNASEGHWERAVPQGNGGTRGDPTTDGDGSGRCYVTDNSLNGDVDNGSTTLLSPTFDASGEGSAIVSYYVWYVNNGNSFVDDEMTIEISNNDGASWTLLDELTQSTNGWELHSHVISDVIEPTSQMRIRFTAEDTGIGSIVEAGIDGVRIDVFVCEASALVGDLNGDGFVNGADLAALLAQWGTDGTADLTGDHVVNGADLALLLANWT